MPTVEERLEYLKCEIAHLTMVGNYLRQIVPPNPRVWCCAIDFFPHIGGHCPIHPEAERIRVKEALSRIEGEITDLEVLVLDMEANIGK